MRRLAWIAATALAFAAAACSPAATERGSTAAGTAATAGGDRQSGRLVFAANCSPCHGATGLEGGYVGPSLRHEDSRMDYGATVSWIEDSAPPMPKLYPKMLTAGQVRDVAAYVQSL